MNSLNAHDVSEIVPFLKQMNNENSGGLKRLNQAERKALMSAVEIFAKNGKAVISNEIYQKISNSKNFSENLLDKMIKGISKNFFQDYIDSETLLKNTLLLLNEDSETLLKNTLLLLNEDLVALKKNNSDYNNFKMSNSSSVIETQQIISDNPQLLIETSQAVLQKLRAIDVLTEIKNIAISAKGPPSTFQLEALNKLKGELPEEMQGKMDKLNKTTQELMKFAQEELQSLEVEIKGSKDLGGHGGTFSAKITLPNKDVHQLFLKPLDETEFNNYQMIDSLDQRLNKFMPKVYGAIKWEGRNYLVMENTRIDKKGQELPQLVDAKLAGKLEGKSAFNPIADQEEMKVTRGEEKNFIDYFQMKIGAENAPNYMVAKGPKILRLLYYSDSVQNLQSSLGNTTPQALETLKTRLDKLYTILEDSPIAFIGASIIFIKEEDGNIKPLLIDPAHIQVDPEKKETLLGSTMVPSKVYYGNKQDFLDRKESNLIGLSALSKTVETKRVDAIKTATLNSSELLTREGALEKNRFHTIEDDLLFEHSIGNWISVF